MKRLQGLLSTVMLFLTLLISQQIYANKIIKIDGSSTVYSITEAIAEEF